MKKILIVSGMALVLTAAVATQNAYAGKSKAPNTVNVKAQTALNFYFPDASGVRWIEKKQISTAYFTEEEGKAVAQFDRKGHLVSTVLYHRDTNLPVNISMNLKKDYQDYHVRNVVEYTDVNNHCYFVLLESSGKFIRVRITDAGQPVVLEQLSKA